VILLCVSASIAHPARAVLAPTPYMGWNTYYGVGGVFNEGTITSVADTLVSDGLAKAGYRIVWLDYGWATGARDGEGNLIVDSSQWPHGLAWLTAYLHARGLLAGIYTDAGTSGCNEQGVGSLGHYQQDADAFAAWGFDAVKVDFCGAGQAGLSPESEYAQFAAALANNSSHRPLLLNVCNFWEPGQIDGAHPSFADSAFGNYQWAAQIAQSWRTDTDVGGHPGSGIRWVNVLRNLHSDAAHPQAAGPGHWNDPDYLGPELGMTPAEAHAQFSMWAILAAPLILASDPRALSPASITMLKNPSVIAIDQDPLGIQGRVVRTVGRGQVWVKALDGGDRAMALLNRGSKPVRLVSTAGAAGLAPAGTYRMNDLWSARTAFSTGRFDATVGSHSASLYRITALPAAAAVVGADGRLYVHAPRLASNWERLGPALTGAPVVVAVPHRRAGPYREPLFIALGRDHAIFIRGIQGRWQKLASAHCLDRPGAAFVRSTLYVACEGTDHAIWYGESGLPRSGLPYVRRLYSLGGSVSAGPAIAPVRGRVAFFVSGPDHLLSIRTLHRGYARFRFPCYGRPAADTAPRSTTTYAACEGKSGNVYVMSTTRRGWSAKTSYGGSFMRGPGLAATSGGLVVLATTRHGRVLFTGTPNRWTYGGLATARSGVGADGVG
jgi:hypothetical protein